MNRRIVGIDLFCGAGGLTYGLRRAGIDIVAGVDSDPACEYPFTANNDAKFILSDIRKVTADDLRKLYPRGVIRLLAGCAPCRPFSPIRRGSGKPTRQEWGLLREFMRLVTELKPELVTMENVPHLASKRIFREFVRSLKDLGYVVEAESVYCPPLGIPQHRRRLVLMASRIGKIRVPVGFLEPDEYPTVRDTIADMNALGAGTSDPTDKLHRARRLSDLNLQRIAVSKPGGTWADWSRDLRAKCHRKRQGRSYRSVYARMVWDEPSPTITTLAYSFGSGRFGHPEQDRPITPREAALLQTFPKSYRFVAPRRPVGLRTMGRLIGNAVPPKLGSWIGKELRRTADSYTKRTS